MKIVDIAKISFEMIGYWQWFLILVTVFVFILPSIIALVDILRNEFKGNNKIVWVLVVLLSNFIGAILYFFIGRHQKLKQETK